MLEIFFGDKLRRWRCMNCERIYVLWKYRTWRREHDMQVRGKDGAGQVEREVVG